MLKERAKAFMADEKGATAIEYGLIAAGIFLGIISPVAALSSNLDATYQQILQYLIDTNG
ncbi:MAG: Flp family type IVb pilin [Rhizobiales bacterium]|nr:Flp family type IVb pilin [Hyphomicrobiales bacterium]